MRVPSTISSIASISKLSVGCYRPVVLSNRSRELPTRLLVAAAAWTGAVPPWLLGPSGLRCRRVGCLLSFCYGRLSSRTGALISWDLRCPTFLVLAVPVRCSFFILAWTTSRRCCCCLARSLLFFGKFLIIFIASSVFCSAPTTPDGFRRSCF